MVTITTPYKVNIYFLEINTTKESYLSLVYK